MSTSSLVEDLLVKESVSESLINRGYALVHYPTEMSLIYASLYSASQLFFNSSKDIKQQFAQVQFNENHKSPNSLHGYSLVQNVKEQFMIRYLNSNSYPNLKEIKTPNDEFSDKQTNDFGVLSMLFFEKADIFCRNLMRDLLVLLNKSVSILDEVLDPINVKNGRICREVQSKSHCFGEYTLDGYIYRVSSSVLDCYHYFACAQDKFGHDQHTDSGLMTLIGVTESNPSLQVFDQKEATWVNIEELIHAHSDKNKLKKHEFGVVLLGDSVSPYINRHINNSDHKLKQCMYRIDNGHKERFSVVYKQRTSPLRSHPRYDYDYYLGKLHSEIDVDSVHQRLMKKSDKSKDYKNYNKYYEYSAMDKTKIAVLLGSFVVFGLYFMRRRGILNVSVQFNR